MKLKLIKQSSLTATVLCKSKSGFSVKHSGEKCEEENKPSAASEAQHIYCWVIELAASYKPQLTHWVLSFNSSQIHPCLQAEYIKSWCWNKELSLLCYYGTDELYSAMITNILQKKSRRIKWASCFLHSFHNVGDIILIFWSECDPKLLLRKIMN